MLASNLGSKRRPSIDNLSGRQLARQIFARQQLVSHQSGYLFGDVVYRTIV